jgi:thiosulfate dehydrogenase
MTTIEILINECFERSLNGKALPYDSSEMGALVSYIAWMSKGVPAGSKLQGRGFPPVKISRPGNPANGRSLYEAQCAICHGADGQGNAAAPPVWGPNSYNKGAGMARISIAASFIKRNMPLGRGNTLTDEEAYDLASFINSQPRPEFPARVNDWPKGGRPDDILY